MFNSIILIGNVGWIGDYYDEGDGKTAKISFSVACNKWSPGMKEEPEPDWFNVTAWGKTASRLAEKIEKGQRLMIQGTMRSYKDKEGNERWNLSAQIVRSLTPARGAEGRGAPRGRQQTEPADATRYRKNSNFAKTPPTSAEPVEAPDDDCPF